MTIYTSKGIEYNYIKPKKIINNGTKLCVRIYNKDEWEQI